MGITVVNPNCGYFQTLEDMLVKFYGFDPCADEVDLSKAVNTRIHRFDYQNQQLEFLAQAVTSGEVGYYNTIYGAITSRLFLEETAMGKLLGARPWNLSGFRAVEAAGTRPALGYSEGGSLAAPGKSIVAQIEVPVKTLHTTYEETLQAVKLQPTKDSVELPFNRDEAEKYFMDQNDKDMLRPIATATDDDVTSLLKIVSSFDEVNNNAGIPLTAADIYDNNVVRSTGASVYDSYVIENGGTPVTFTEALLKELIDNTSVHWDGGHTNRDNKFMITGFDTKRAIDAFSQGKQQYEGSKYIEFTRNGVRISGRPTGFSTTTYDNIPIFPLTNMPSSGGDLSQLVLLDGNYIDLRMLVPFTNTETNFDSDMILLDKMSKQGLIYMLAEIWANKFSCHGKITDINSA